MGFGSPFFVLRIIAMVLAARVAMAAIRSKGGAPDHHHRGADHLGGRETALLSAENEKLKSMICRLEERIAVLERIATDAPHRLSAEIERLR